MSRDNPLIWVEISKSALERNFQTFREIVGSEVELAPMVKSNAYGHGLELCAQVFCETGADYLAVNSVFEAEKIRAMGDKGKIYIAGYTPLDELQKVIELDCEFVVFNLETLEKLGKLEKSPPAPLYERGEKVKIHLKVETGTNRQGVQIGDIPKFLEKIKSLPNVELVGVAMHFADIEDTTNHDFAKQQLAEFEKIKAEIEQAGFQNLKFHAANSAATLLWDSTHFAICRTGIANYGMWPSDETFVSLAEERKKKIVLQPALTWKTKIAQIKKIQADESVGYGRAFTAEADMTIAILPVGYYDGFSRAYAEKGSVLIAGKRAKILGRVCMNILMVDVSDIPEAKLEDEVVLLGKSGDEEITAEEMAEWGGTINYEVTTRIRENILRKIVV
ncbi:MAG: alanine racemase [Candidatus Peribacteraceae bacterium]|nr:alanine racemase [Candidatus Peribacteraceae bacterium]